MSNIWPGLDGPGIRYISAPPPAFWQKLKRRSLVILGSTGSIGRSALDVVDKRPGAFAVAGLACATSTAQLAEQALKYRPAHLAVLDEAAARRLEALLPAGYAPTILTGPEGYRTIASIDGADTVLSAQSGAAGLAGTLAAALAGKVVCLANKESLVLAGDLLRRVCRATGASILPVDSEHFAIFDCLSGRKDDAERLVLTASGGPFRGRKAGELAAVTPEMALRHPNWNMGAKITVDSATLMNKALEFIEACQLYGVSPDNVEVLVHPQSIVHSLVVFRDQSQLAQLGVPDMRLPIGACLLWPSVDGPLAAPLDLAQAGTLTFEHPDHEAFPALTLAKKAMQVRAGMSVVLNGADEEAVKLFLEGRCAFTDIAASVAGAMEAHLAKLKMEKALHEGEPFSLAGQAPDLSGAAFATACWEQLGRIHELGEWARRHVREFLAGGGSSRC
ncbi:MAG: 1-deoxy-D-xylulose-5-phosphate reductoisomerase [Desulfovibrio sp.]|nr:1-deoxy-D-xylulose-5-phosphate reductoisomerase [Desulfovibrio sp.]